MSKNVKYLMNRVYVLASVTGNHLQTAMDLYNLHIKFEQKQFFEIHSKEEFIKVLIQIESEIDENSGPVIHIEAHGLESEDAVAKSNGIELSNGEQLYWEDMRPFLIDINAKCGNNLTMVMATCLGMYILQDLIQTFFEDLINSRCPFLMFVGTDKNASVYDFAEAFPVFYQSVYEKEALQTAVIKMNEVSPTKFRCDHAYTAFEACANSFADRQIKNRFNIIQEDPDLLYEYYCELFQYTYESECDLEAVKKIMTDEKFYIDYLNKRRREFLHVSENGPDRFKVITKLTDFEKSIQLINFK